MRTQQILAAAGAVVGIHDQTSGGRTEPGQRQLQLTVLLDRAEPEAGAGLALRDDVVARVLTPRRRVVDEVGRDDVPARVAVHVGCRRIADEDLHRVLARAAAMVGGELAMVTLTWLAFRRRIRLRFIRPLAVAAPLAAGIVAAAHALELTAIWFAPVLGIAFLLAAYLLGAVKRDDILWLMKR